MFAHVPGALIRRSSGLIAAVALLLICGPIMVFPDVLSAAWRTSIVTLITLAALGVAAGLLRGSRLFNIGLWLFVFAVAASWALTPVRDLLAARHFAGIGVGIL